MITEIHDIVQQLIRRYDQKLEELCEVMWLHPGQYAVVVFQPPIGSVPVGIDRDPDVVTYRMEGYGAMLTRPGAYAKADEVTTYQGTHAEWLELNA